jgi:hypothetical protein
MTEGSAVEVVFPRWARGAIKSDLARRPFADQTELNNAQIDALFANRGARVQWVTDWQPLASGTGAVGANPALSWPTTVQYLAYAAGTHVFGRGPTIDLGVVRDSTKNATNDYTAAWTEDAWLMAKFGHESRVVTAAINPSGAVGIGTADANPIA